MAEGKMLLISSHSSPTQFYDLPEARAKVRRFLTSLGGFEEVLEYGFPSDVAVEDTTDDSGGLGCRYLTLRLTLTPWHARADETELYGAPETQGKQQQFRTMMTKFFSRASSSGPLPGMVSGSSTAAPTPAPSPSPSSVHGSKGVASGAASPATVASHSGDSLYSSGKGLKTLAESDQELCSTGDIPSLCSREGLACTGNDDSMDSIVDLPVPCHPFENIGSPETHEAPTWALVGSIAASGGPRYPLSKSRATKSPPLVSASASHRGAASLPSKIPKPLKNRGFKMVNPSSTTAATNVMTQSATNIVMTSSTSSTTPSSVSASTTMTSSMEAAALAANALVTGQLPPLRSPPPRSVTPSRFMALPEIYQPPRKGSLTALSIPIAAASAGSGSASIYRSQLGAGGSALDMLTAPFMPARRKVSSPAIFNSPETRRQIGDDHYSSSAATNGSSSTHNLLQDGFRIRAHVSPSAPASPLHWPVYIPTGSTTTTTTKSTAADKEGDALTEAELIPVDGFAARSSKRSALDLQKSGLKPLSSSTSTTPPLVSSAASSPLPSPLLFPRTLGGAATPVQPQQPQQPPQPRGTAVPPPRPPRKRSDQLEKSPLAPAGAIAGDSVVSGKAATTVDAATTTEPKEGEDPPFEDVLLSKPLPPGALYKGSSSSPQRSAPTTTTSSSDPTVVDPLATTTATATVALRPQPVIQSDIFFETPAGLPNYQMDYVVPDLTLTPTPTPALSPTSTPAPAPALVATVAPVQVSNYVFGPPREPYQPRTRYIPNRRPTARQPMAIECTTTTSGTAAATLAKGTTAVVGDIPLQMRQEGNATVAELSHEGDGEGDDDDSDEGGDDDGDDDDDDDNSEDGQVWEMVTLPSTAPPLLSSSVSSGHIDASLARPHPTIDSPSPLSSLTRSPSNHHHRLSQAHRHQQQQPRRGIATASMVMAELRRPGQEPYVYGWSSVSNGAGVGNGSLDGSGLDPASFDEEDLIFGAYDYSYEDDGLHHHQSEQSLELQQEEDDEEDEEEGDEDGEEEGQVPTYATATTTMTTTTTSPLENVKEENDDEEEGEGDDNDEKKKKRRRRRMAMDARSETSEATTIYGQARIGIRMRAHHRTSHGDSHGGSVVTIRPHGQVVTVVGMAQAEGVGR
ncbi:hypothetical protein DFQ27_007352 [Actinomortierella ambigua]|uniref:Uncharacterized protein n=1 Tax=Actinomortierella ambigua TaxID=1343610 RepID=A0A9P6PWN9_9FUNG|nr:hypothetical protein DFQ27_007352 [Actinomortierella ambigua]